MPRSRELSTPTRSKIATVSPINSPAVERLHSLDDLPDERENSRTFATNSAGSDPVGATELLLLRDR